MLEQVKRALQITDDIFDDELRESIESAKTDLGFANVEIIADDDAQTQRAIILYCSYQFQVLHGEIDRANALFECYNNVKSQMRLSSKYNAR